MNLNAIAKRVAYKESFPWRRTAIVSFDPGGLQPRSQSFHVGAFQAKVPLRILPGSRVFHGEMNIQSPGIEPNPAAGAQRFWFRNLAQPKTSSIK